MTTTANGRKATAVRGASRVHLVESATRVELVEVKPGLRIQDVDTDAVPAPGFENWTHATLMSASRQTRRGDSENPGWYVEAGTNWYGPIATKADAIRHLRHEFTQRAARYWTDAPTVIKVAKSTIYSDMTRRRKNYYECTGPDGTRFDNTGLADLRDRLRLRYGRVELDIAETTLAPDVRKTLKAEFPDTRFSVRTVWGGVEVAWVDGPEVDRVEAVAGRGVGLTRSFSPEVLAQATREWAAASGRDPQSRGTVPELVLPRCWVREGTAWSQINDIAAHIVGDLNRKKA